MKTIEISRVVCKNGNYRLLLSGDGTKIRMGCNAPPFGKNKKSEYAYYDYDISQWLEALEVWDNLLWYFASNFGYDGQSYDKHLAKVFKDFQKLFENFIGKNL
ncbi:MAG: hypothetical protein ACTSPW_15030 [Promethearchaeota archaeon]